MSAPAAPAAAAPTEATARKRRSKLPLIIVALVFTAAGAVFPMVVDVPALFAKSKSDKAKHDTKTVIVPFSDVVVNLHDEKMTRYLRLKIAVTAEAEYEKQVTEELTKHKAAIKSKIISHVAGKNLKDVSGSVGVTRLQRELLEKFEDELYPDGNSHIRAVLFEEYVIQ